MMALLPFTAVHGFDVFAGLCCRLLALQTAQMLNNEAV